MQLLDLVEFLLDIFSGPILYCIKISDHFNIGKTLR